MWLFKLLDGIVGGFNLDPCASEITAKCKNYFTPKENGLKKEWGGKGTKAFVNSPYGRVLPKWVYKSHDEHLQGADVVQLLPARVETRWFQTHAPHTRAIWFPKRRIRFLRPCAHPGCKVLTETLYKSPTLGSTQKVPYCDRHAPEDMKGSNSPTFPSAVLFFTHREYDLDPLRSRGMVIEARGYNPAMSPLTNQFYRDRAWWFAQLYGAAANYFAMKETGELPRPDLITEEEAIEVMYLMLEGARCVLEKAGKTHTWTEKDLGPLFASRL